ncbi:MAG: hypothetical protein JSR36_02175 [Proteobacteria bacterium]|nr:hypothetical protein [Pseudomonadota bacterium]
MPRTLRSLIAPALVAVLLCSRALAGDFQAVAATDKAWRPRGAHLTLAAALQVAEASAATRGMNVAEFQPPWFRYDYDVYYPDMGLGDYAWAFVYEAKAPGSDSHFMVVVNDRTQYAQFIPGR